MESKPKTRNYFDKNVLAEIVLLRMNLRMEKRLMNCVAKISFVYSACGGAAL